MGGSLTKIKKQDIRILMVGLNGVGKTTILYRLAFGAVIHCTVPTIGHNTEVVRHGDMSFLVSDFGGSTRHRNGWIGDHWHETRRTAIVFVVDSNDRARIDASKGCPNSAKFELQRLLNSPHLQDAPLLILANKQDLPAPMTTDEISERLELSTCARDWKILACSVKVEAGLLEGLDWLCDELSDEPRRHRASSAVEANAIRKQRHRALQRQALPRCQGLSEVDRTRTWSTF